MDADWLSVQLSAALDGAWAALLTGSLDLPQERPRALSLAAELAMQEGDTAPRSPD